MSANHSNLSKLGSSGFAQSYAPSGALGADVDLVAAGGGPCRFFTVGVAGNLELVTSEGADVIVYAVQLGQKVEVEGKTLKAAGTTAQKITAYWLWPSPDRRRRSRPSPGCARASR
jgi:hypothetical protein